MILRTLVLASLTIPLAALPAHGQSGSAPSARAGVDSAHVARLLRGRDRWKTDFSRIAVSPSEIVSGGPPKDGIRSIDRPKFVSAADADGWLDDADPVMVIEHGGEVKAYPLRILIWHEIVNDVVGGKPVTVTYCPLCNSALAFDREVAGLTLDFGTTGRLRQSDLVMYDRQTESWWQQAVGEAIVGRLTGTRLDYVPANTLSWKMARSLYPNLRALSRDTGARRNYGANPYAGYDTRGGPIPGFFRGRPDRRLPVMERVVALNFGDGWAAPFSILKSVRVVNDEVEGHGFTVFWAPGAASAVDRRRVSKGRDVGQTAVFDRKLGERTLTFEWRDGSFRDRETGSRWDLAGRATAGPLVGQRLTAIPHGDHFWFAWAAFRPDTEVWSDSR
ncbi:MAG: DUF3179 domain-containing protein [Gemmatimonadota bacterium]